MTGVHQLIDDDFTRGLACAALTPGLRRILLFDISKDKFFSVADQLATMLKEVTRETYRRVILGSAEAEDDLWTTLEISGKDKAIGILLTPGRLAPPPDDPSPVLILIPDLPSLSLNAARACVALMGEGETATLQRHGLNITWSPNMCWLARCARAEVGEISPHLLDRFVLRLSPRDAPSLNRVADVLAWANDQNSDQRSQTMSVSPELADALRSASPQAPNFSADEVIHVLSYFSQQVVEGMRRELALARLSRALAQLEGVLEVSASHVNAAAGMVGLQPITVASAPVPVPELPVSPVAERTSEEAVPTEGGSVAVTPEPRTLSEDPSDDRVLKSDTQLTFDTEPAVSLPYPEDTAPAEREVDSLQFPPQRFRATGAAEGPVIGTQPARRVNDIAVVSTVIEAAKFQKVRPPAEPPARFPITRADLRSYRRAPTPEQTLTLIIDYTSLTGCLWKSVLWSHLRWAYVARASVKVVQVGFAKPRSNNLRAELISARNLLSPRIREALNGRGGIATPLAHGLDLATRSLRSALQHGRSRTQQARLVVITDARGNVPLAASRAGHLEQPVFRDGIDDALAAARALRTLNNLEIYFLNPQPQQYPELPAMLAEVLGANIEYIPRDESL